MILAPYFHEESKSDMGLSHIPSKPLRLTTHFGSGYLSMRSRNAFSRTYSFALLPLNPIQLCTF